MAFDIEGARKAGYSDDEIADHLGAQRGLDVPAARKAGYTSREILAEVSDAWAKKPLPADVQPSTAGAGRGGQGGPTAEQAASARPAGLANARRGGTRSEARPYVAPDAPGEVLSRPPAEPVQGQQPLIEQRGAPVGDEVLQATLQQLSTMTRDQRLAQEKRTDIPAWMRSTVAAANRRLEAADLGAERTGMTGPTIEARTARNMRDGADLPTARAAAVARASAGVPTNGLQQATPGPGLLTGDEVNANRAEGEKVRRQSIGARGMYAAQEGLIGGTAGVIAAGLRAIGDGETAKFYEKVGQGAAVRAQASGELQRMQAAARDAGILPSGPLSGLADYADEMATGAANSVGQMIPGLVAGIATGNAAVGLGLMALPVFGQSYIAKRDDGGSPAAAAGYGGTMAALEIIGERYGLMPAALNAFRKQAATKTLEELPGFLERGIVAMERRGLFSKSVGAVLRTQAGEQVGEQITSAGQYLLDGTEFGLDQPISLGGFLANARDTAVQTLLATGAVQAAGAGAKSLMDQAGAGDPSRQVGRALAKDVQGAEFQRDAIDGYAARASDPRFYDPTFVDPRNTTKAAAAATPAAPRARPAPRPTAAALQDDRIEPTMPVEGAAPQAPTDGAQAADNITGILQQAGALPDDFTGLDEAPAVPPPVEGEKINRNWSAFAPESGTLGIPREQMPQVKAEHRGALVQFLNARGITHEAGEVPATDLKPTQAEFSPRKVGQAREFTGGDRAILVSQDGHVLDGHHQWLAKREAGEPVRVIRLNAPINDLLRLTHQFPSSTTASGAKRLPAQPEAPADDNQRDMAVPAPVVEGAGADGGAVAGGSGGTVGSQPAGDGGVQPAAEAPAPSGGTAVPAGNARQPDQALTQGQRVTIDGAAWTVDKVGAASVTLTDAAGGKRVVARNSKTFGQIQAEAAPAPAEAPRSMMKPGFDPDAWQKERDDRIKASRDAGNTHLDKFPAYVETMRGKDVYDGVHDTKVRGRILTVDNNGNVYVEWLDAYSQEKEGAVPMKYGKKTVMQTSLGPRDLKDYVVGNPTQEPDEAARPQPQTPAGESAAPAAAPAATAPVVSGARSGAVEAAGLTDQPPKRTEARGTAKHPRTVMGSRILAIVSMSGGLNPSLLSEFSERVETGRKDKNGLPTYQWRNPLIPGVGRLFRRGGTSDYSQLGELMEEAGYLPAGSSAADYKEAGENAKQIIKDALGRSEAQTQDEILAEAEARRDALAQESEPDEYAHLDPDTAAEAEAERQAIMASNDIDPGRMDATADDDIPFDGPGLSGAAGMRASGMFSEQEIADAEQQEREALQQSRTGGKARQDGPEGARPAAEAGSPAARPAGQEEGLTLTAQTPADLKAKAEREESAAKAERAKKEAEQARLRKEAEARDLKARADQTVDDFQLGQDAEQQMSGMDDLFADPPAAPAPAAAPSPDAPQSVRTQEDPAKISEAEASKRLEWRNLGQRDNTTTHAVYFDGMQYGTVTLFKGDSRFKVDDGEPQLTLKKAKAEAERLAIGRLVRDGYVQARTLNEDGQATDGLPIGEQPRVPRSILRPLVPAAPAAEPATTAPTTAPTPAPTPAPAPVPRQESEAKKKARADLLAGLGELGGILSKNTRANILPEQEQQLLPVLTKVFDAALRLGYHSFKDSAKFVLDKVRELLGAEVADAITLDHMQGAYIGMAGRYKGMPGVSSKRDVVAVEDKAEVEAHQASAVGEDDNAPADQEQPDAPVPNPDLERNRADAEAAQPAVGQPVRGDGPADGAAAAGGDAGSAGRGRANDPGLPAGGAAAGRVAGDQPVRGADRADKPSELPARNRDGERSDDPGIAGVQPEAVAADRVAQAAVAGLDAAGRLTRQQAAESVPVKPGDLDNIRATLPYLLPGQQEDVHKAEQRFAKEDGYGMLFTNGTGTGKTFTGLGIVKRMQRQGKTNTLVLVPDAKIMADWVDSAKPLGLTITPLVDTKDGGKGITITTYANAGMNDELARRDWDLVVADEAHSLMQSADAKDTLALDVVRAITLHPRGMHDRHAMLNREDIAKLKDLNDRITGNIKILNNTDTTDQMMQSVRAETDRLQARADALAKKLRQEMEKVRAHVEGNQGLKRPRLAALSATPFAYVETVDWAEGYLFDYAEGFVQQGGYNAPNERQQFFMTRFGYRMRSGKLTKPDAKVNSGLMERQFNAWLRKRGSLSGRALDVAADYDRRFVLVDSRVGNEIDKAIGWINDKSRAEGDMLAALSKANPDAARIAPTPWSFLRAALDDSLYGSDGHLVRRYLLEAIKAKEVVPHIREHLALGRKVVVFHDFKKGGAINPFRFEKRAAGKVEDSEDQAKVEAQVRAWNEAVDQFNAEFPGLAGDALLSDLQSPIARFTKEFPGVLLINGDEKPADLLRRYKTFNDDAAGPVVALVQSAKNKGWSGHDTTGKHQRVLFNLGLPTQPTMAIQQEGRIYRTGQVSNAVMRYLNTGTNWEKWAFAQTIASRASTAENLASGEGARALRDAFIDAFTEADDFRAGHAGEGTGGKARDSAANNALSEFDRAKSAYWGTAKKSARTKAQEGTDYFATPEPLGLKMVQWADLRGGEDALEPSGGHGAIARWLPDNVNRTAVEPSDALGARLAMVFDGKIIRSTFEELHVGANKFDGIAMNPPFGTAGRTAVDHLAKAAEHLRDFGRVVAIIPEGSATDRFDKWFYEEATRPAKPIAKHPTLGPIYRGDTLTISAFGGASTLVVDQVDGPASGPQYVRPAGASKDSGINMVAINKIEPTGKRTETHRPAERLHMVAEVKLPAVTFERAGTAVRTRVVVIDKLPEGVQPQPSVRLDLSNAENITEFFDRLEPLEVPRRLKPEVADTETEDKPDPRKQQQAEKQQARTEGVAAAAEVGLPIVEHTTGKGKLLKGVIRRDLTQAQAKEVDAFTFKKDGGWFIRAEHMPAMMTKFPPANDTAFSRQRGPNRGVPMADAKAVVATIRAALPAAPPVHLMETLSQAPKALRDTIKAQGAEDLEAAYHAGEIYVFPRNIESIERMQFVVGHHEVRHHGIRMRLGTGDELGAAMHAMWSGNQALRKAAQAKMDAGLANTRALAVEEALADMDPAEVARFKGWPRLVSAIRQWLRQVAAKLRKAGMAALADSIEPKTWTDADVARFVFKAEDVSRSGVSVMRAGGTVFGQDAAPVWRSVLMDQVLASQMNAGPASAWQSAVKNWISTGKVKADEVEWSGLADWLDVQQGKVTRQQVADYLQGAGVRVTETVLGGNSALAASVRDEQRRIFSAWGYKVEPDPYDTERETIYDSNDEEVDFFDLPEELQDAIRAAQEREQAAQRASTKYENYTLPGGTNYREVLLTLPGKGGQSFDDWLAKKGIDPTPDAEHDLRIQWARDNNARGSTEYRSGHWDQPNILAHIRVNDRTDADGNRVLFVEEVQSDYAQDARKKGIQKKPETVESLDDPRVRLERRFEDGKELTDVYLDGENVQTWTGNVPADYILADLNEVIEKRAKKGVPAAPYIDATDKWVALALKRVIKMAVDGGYDKVAFVTGQQSADRYDLSKQIESVEYRQRTEGAKAGTGLLTAYDLSGNQVVAKPDVRPEDLPDIIGKEAAERLMQNQGPGYMDSTDKAFVLSGEDLKVGGEGMRAFYDRIVPAVAKDVLRKLGGGALETVALEDSTPVATLSRTTGRYFITQDGPTFETREEANAWARDQVAKQPGFNITDTMRQRAAGGMPVFARVWHGTPYRGIQRFDTEAIGTGEGNQAYGWGLYFASRREVADFYRRSLSGEGGRVFTKDGRTIESPADLAEAYFQPGRIVRGYSGADKVLQFQRTGDNWLVQVVGVKANGEPMSSERPRWHSTQPDAPTLRDVLEEDGWRASAAGQLYEVDIPDDGDMLLWDKPMAEQPERVRAALAPFLVEREAELRNLWRGFSDQAATEKELRYALNATGQAIYEQIGYAKGGDRAASEYLHSIGVPGIKYRDAMSRNGANGSFNYVVFSGDDATIAGTVFSRPPRHDPATTETLAKAGIRQPVSMRQHLAAAAGRAMQVLRSRAELMAEARQGALDQFHGIQRAVQRDLGGLPLDQDPYIAARLANGGSSSVMRALLLHGQAKWADNGQHLVKIDGTKGLLDILAPLGEDVHDWFGWMIGNRAARLMREGRENNFTADDIKRLQALATPEKKAAFQKAAMEYASFKRSVLDVAQAAGLINPETRKTWDYADYIPFYRQVDAGTDGVSAPRMGRKGLAGQSSGIRVLRGGEAALNDPIENLLMNFSRLIDASLKNNAIAKTIDLLQEAGSEAVHKVGYDFTAAIVPAEQMRKKLVEAGTPEQVLDAIPPEVFEGMAKLWALQAPSDPDVVRVMVGGKPQFYRVNDPLLLRSLTSFVPFDFPGLGLMRGAKRLLTSMVTATPEFLARNFIRDTVAAQAITREGFSPAKSFAGVVKSWRETGAAEAMLFAGASFGSGQVNAGDPAGTGAELRRALRARGLNAAGIDGYMASLLDTPAKLWEKWRNVTDAVENANREAVYEATLKGGGSATAAAYESKDLMDFSLRGSWPAYQLLADVVPFLNARVQGLYRLGRADPKRLAAVGGLLMVATMLLAMGNDGEDWYEELPDWDKDTNWHFRIGGQHFRIPKPFEIGVVFATIPERIGRSIKGLDNGSKTASRLWANVRDQLAFDPVPQLIRPVLNVWANWDTFRQAPIETERDEGKLAAQRYDARTSDTARVLAGAAAPVVNSLELSPKRMEYLVTGYFGTVGAYALGLSDMVVRKLDGKPQGPSLRADDVPLVKAFYRVDPARSTVYESDLYLMRQEVEKVYRSVTALKKDDPAAAVELATQEQDKLALRSVIVNATKRLAALRRQADAIYADTKMTPQEKRQRLDAIQVQKNAIAKQAATIPEALTAF